MAQLDGVNGGKMEPLRSSCPFLEQEALFTVTQPFVALHASFARRLGSTYPMMSAIQYTWRCNQTRTYASSFLRLSSRNENPDAVCCRGAALQLHLALREQVCTVPKVCARVKRALYGRPKPCEVQDAKSIRADMGKGRGLGALWLHSA